jgi:hypothetical protein
VKGCARKDLKGILIKLLNASEVIYILKRIGKSRKALNSTRKLSANQYKNFSLHKHALIKEEDKKDGSSKPAKLRSRFLICLFEKWLYSFYEVRINC